MAASPEPMDLEPWWPLDWYEIDGNPGQWATHVRNHPTVAWLFCWNAFGDEETVYFSADPVGMGTNKLKRTMIHTSVGFDRLEVRSTLLTLAYPGGKPDEP